MKFTYGPDTYLLEFERQQRVPSLSVLGVKRIHTMARLLRVTGPEKKDREIVREYTVGWNPHDRFSLEAGRKWALTLALFDAPTKGGGAPLLGTILTKDFRTAVWHCYHGRKGRA